ncbi:ImuA family protein [Novosphingobium piscinae]|uniref:Protein ImuA n=1 Tax=Novosphingobium piscinae TaxID=1507448 RepID=A0A7X1KPS2_9SPHN|nr:hypothetical protein [Novosphingobium piscinae]MBC2669027.1 hypothetical protein [Novosphingobium piscinae]
MRVAPILSPDSGSLPAAPVLRHWASGVASLDAALGGGFAQGRVHEFYAASEADAGAVRGLAVGLGAGMAGPDRSVLWLRCSRTLGRAGVLQASGWSDLGGRPGQLLLGIVPDTLTLLRSAADALRSAAPGLVVIEGWGRMAELDLTASRRLALAAERSGVALLLLRIEAQPVPSAAQTRWQVASAPSRALPGQAPGAPTFDLVLLRQRAGPCGLDWRLEWHRDQCKFREAPLPGAVVPVPAGRPLADRTGRQRDGGGDDAVAGRSVRSAA